ncbi:DNA topoisomerase 1 [Poriferisphaera corsica]|uniref:DNA topoisomerase 1 n=1 Tax=Poriferisphaera corsica TaxID=2528020 RepID=A0A517YWR2_9BACT|nr:type I DNA topoisomerase [Poriferisphaera corsica]QDU34639.1 DNA topoisomerase 1 [Poriferisphaera corsica]
MAKKKATKKKASKKKATKKKASTARRSRYAVPDATDKQLVIVESPTKAKTINKYLGPDYVVMASVGHVRDLPMRNPKGIKNPVPGVDLENNFEPSYDILPDKKDTVKGLTKAAKQARDVWFATDLDREGEAIAWHLAHALDVNPNNAKRVVFNAITKSEIDNAFAHPRAIEDDRVNAQQARRILDRIVGYQVSPLLWKKVAGGLSAGRVQSVATRLVVEREREIDAFTPDEYWKITGLFATDPTQASPLAKAWQEFLDTAPIKPNTFGNNVGQRTIKEQIAWLSENKALKAELFELAGAKFQPDNRTNALSIAQALGFALDQTIEDLDEKAKGPAQNTCKYLGHVAEDAPIYKIDSITTKRSKSRPPAPFITSTMQQQASTRIGFTLKRTMRVAQQLYEGIDLKGARGQTGLITYMRTDSTHISGQALNSVRSFIEQQYGPDYLPDKPNFYASSNKSAQEAHEAIRPTDPSITPESIRSRLSDEQFKLYDLIWRRFVACQMAHAQSDSTTVVIAADTSVGKAKFKATGRNIVFDGFYRVSGYFGDDIIFPPLTENQPVGPMHLNPTQHFTSPPPRYTEASLQKKLEEEGIGRPSTYAAIIGTIQDRKYVETLTPRDKRLMATDLGMVVTDMLAEAFPVIMDVPYTRQMEAELDKIETEHHDWKQMLADFYGPFKTKLETAHETLQHAKAVQEPAPYKCETCGADTVYRFGKNGRFLSCSRYPDCKYAAPVDREGKPQQPEQTDILCPIDDKPMIKRKGRFGPFLASSNYPEVKFILKIDPKTHAVVLPKTPPMLIEVECPKCGEQLNVRDSKRGFWLSCSAFPKCRGRGKLSDLTEDQVKDMEEKWAKHVADNPQPNIKTAEGITLTDDTYVPRVMGEDSEQPADVA